MEGPVWSGTEMIVWGGLMGPSTTMDDGGRYNPTTDVWTPADQTGADSSRCAYFAWAGTGFRSHTMPSLDIVQRV